jgi:hypothetical protein
MRRSATWRVPEPDSRSTHVSSQSSGSRLLETGPRAAHGRARHAELRRSGLDSLYDLGGVMHDDGDPNLGVGGRERAEQERHDVDARSRARSHGQHSGHDTGHLGDLALGALDLLEHAARVRKQDAPRFGQVDAAVAAVEECRAQRGLQALHLHRHGRLGDSELTSGLRERRALDDGDEGAQL